MNKTELINEVAEKGELSKKDATKAVDALFDSISEALKNGAVITIGATTLILRAADSKDTEN